MKTIKKPISFFEIENRTISDLKDCAVKWLLYKSNDKTLGNIYLEYKNGYYTINNGKTAMFVQKNLNSGFVKYMFIDKSVLISTRYTEMNQKQKTYENEFLDIKSALSAFNVFLNMYL